MQLARQTGPRRSATRVSSLNLPVRDPCGDIMSRPARVYHTSQDCAQSSESGCSSGSRRSKARETEHRGPRRTNVNAQNRYGQGQESEPIVNLWTRYRPCIAGYTHIRGQSIEDNQGYTQRGSALVAAEGFESATADRLPDPGLMSPLRQERACRIAAASWRTRRPQPGCPPQPSVIRPPARRWSPTGWLDALLPGPGQTG